ncbi:MAG: band 7 protein [Planctomycetes bacterium]|nr:band 7 protein [Planctomycetota bacterium]
MAEIKRFPIVRHLRSEPSQHVLRFRRGRLVGRGRGLTFWFHPLSASISEVPVDDRELPFLFHGRSRDFQDAVVQGVISYRVADAGKLAERVDFTVDLESGAHRHKPMEKLAGLFTDLSQQFALEYLVHTDLEAILADGVEEMRSRIEGGLREDRGFREMGLEIVSVRVGAIKPEAEVERALQVRVREAIQQQADEATFQRRALAVEKERAIQENELQNQIELARREEQLIAQQGDNERKRITDENDAARIASEGAALRREIRSTAKAAGIRTVEEAQVAAERDRMAIYREFPADRLLGLAARALAGKLERIEHLNLTPDLLAPLLTNLVGASAKHIGSTNGEA